MKRFECGCKHSVFRIYTDDTQENITEVKCRKCKRIYKTKVISLGDKVEHKMS